MDVTWIEIQISFSSFISDSALPQQKRSAMAIHSGWGLELFDGSLSVIYIQVLFSPVKPELGVIPSGQENHSKAEHLNFPRRELNVIYYRAILSLKKNQRPVTLGL